MEEAALLMPGAGALDEAQKVLGDPTFLPAVQRDLDVDGDLKVSLSEALDVDRILAILRARAKIDVVSPEIDALVRRFVQRQRQQFQLDVNEEEPAAPLHTIEGSPTLIVEFAADSVPFASLDVLLDELLQLLGKWRAVVDGDGSPPDFVSGSAALRIRQRIDATVAMLNVLVAVR